MGSHVLQSVCKLSSRSASTVFALAALFPGGTRLSPDDEGASVCWPPNADLFVFVQIKSENFVHGARAIAYPPWYTLSYARKLGISSRAVIVEHRRTVRILIR